MGNLFACCCYFGRVRKASNGLLRQRDGSQKEEVDPQIASLIYDKTKCFPEETQLSIAILKNGDICYYGVRRTNNEIGWTSDSSPQHHVFEIGSITKVLTCTLLAQLVVAGKIDLEGNINDLVKVPLRNNIQIPIKTLASHTAGLPRMPSNIQASARKDPKNPYKHYSPEKLEEYLTNDLVLSPKTPGTKYTYSNLGVALLGYGLSVSQGAEYEELLQAHVFSKYNMHHSTTTTKSIQNEDSTVIKEKLLVPGLDKRGKQVPNWDLNVLVGAGGVLSNVEDLSKFVLCHFDDDTMTTTSNKKALALTREITYTLPPGWKRLRYFLLWVLTGDNIMSRLVEKRHVGLGWHILTTKTGDTWHWHNGGTGGYRSCMAMNVEQKTAVIVLSNVSAFHWQNFNIDALCLRLMDYLL